MKGKAILVANKLPVLGVGVKYWDKQGGMMSVKITQIGVFNPTSSNLHRHHAPLLVPILHPYPEYIRRKD